MSALPIPEPRSDDDEDVHWALSTAAALWARGESKEALKWLRRAAETASDANRDARSLELFKAAADFTSKLDAGKIAPPPAAPPPAPAAAAPPRQPGAKSAPPPPPRGRANSRPDGIPDTVLHPHVVTPSDLAGAATVAAPTMPASARVVPPAPTPRAGSSAPTRVSAPSGGFSGGKTLASNTSYEQAARNAGEPLRRAVAKTVNPVQERRAAALPQPAPTPRMPTARAAEEPAQEPVRSKRRGTHSGRRGSSTSLQRVSAELAKPQPPVEPPRSVAIHDVTEEPTRFHDEATHRGEPTLVGLSFPDLDEQTNVLTGKETNLELIASTERPRGVDARGAEPAEVDVSVDSATDPGTGDEDGETRRIALPRGLLSAFRVAIVSADDGRRLEVIPLLPGEPTPSGLVGAMLVATDVASSRDLALLLGKRSQGGK